MTNSRGIGEVVLLLWDWTAVWEYNCILPLMDMRRYVINHNIS